LLASLLRHGKRYGGKSNRTQAHYRWFEGVKFAQLAQQIVCQEYVVTAKGLTHRVAAFEQHIERAAAESVFWAVIGWLIALRGVSLLTATTIMAEIGDPTLINAELNRRLAAAHNANPAEHRAETRTRELAQTNSRMERLLTAYQEELLSHWTNCAAECPSCARENSGNKPNATH
jgi:hypothetical protein